MSAEINEKTPEIKWDGDAGRNWVEAQSVLDNLFAGFEKRLTKSVAALGAGRVLDLGCGTGATTLAAAKILGKKGDAVGVDISGPMINAARERALESNSRASFVQGDIADHDYAPADFDLVVSRFGVMFFDEPEPVFSRIRSAIKPDGSLHFITWRTPQENAFMTAAEDAARQLLPQIPHRRAGEPGQFGLAEESETCRILKQAGWNRVSVEPIDETCVMTREQLESYFIRLGPVGQIHADLDEVMQARVSEAVWAGFSPYVEGDRITFDAACWSIRATV